MPRSRTISTPSSHQHRPLFDRFHRLVLETHPDAAVVLSYKIPTYKGR
jgi:hypothetical protein